MNTSTRSNIDSFQLKGLRQILHLKTTYIDRDNSNAKVFELANKELNRNSKHKITVNTFTEYLEEHALKVFGHVVWASRSSPEGTSKSRTEKESSATNA